MLSTTHTGVRDAPASHRPGPGPIAAVRTLGTGSRVGPVAGPGNVLMALVRFNTAASG
jgi:hypothetical protein